MGPGSEPDLGPGSEPGSEPDPGRQLWPAPRSTRRATPRRPWSSVLFPLWLPQIRGGNCISVPPLLGLPQTAPERYCAEAGRQLEVSVRIDVTFTRSSLPDLVRKPFATTFWSVHPNGAA